MGIEAHWLTERQRQEIRELAEGGETSTKRIQSVMEKRHGRTFSRVTIDRYIRSAGISRRREFPAEVRVGFMGLCRDNPEANIQSLLSLYEAATGYRVPLEIGYSWKHAAKRQEAA